MYSPSCKIASLEGFYLFLLSFCLFIFTFIELLILLSCFSKKSI